MTSQMIAEKIHRRRYQILVHSNIYYGQDKNLIDDATFDKWSRELVDLQTKYPEIADSVEWAEDFKDWDGNSGAFLPYNNLRIEQIANRLLMFCEKKEAPPEKKNAIRKRLF